MKEPCLRRDCRAPVHAKGLCDLHYQQLRAALKRKRQAEWVRGSWAPVAHLDDGEGPR